jgi:hypothetical protein
MLAKKGCPVDELLSQSWDDFAASDAAVINAVVTVRWSVEGEICTL